MAFWICSSFAHSQGNEVTVNYSLVVYNPAKGLSANRILNGGGGSFAKLYGEYFGVKGEFQGYGTTTLTYRVTATPGLIPATNSISTQGNMFTYLFGPQIIIPTPKGYLFAETLFGGAYTNAYANLFKAAGITSLSTSNNGFAMAFGGGIDIPVSSNVAIRPVQLDYIMTRYEWKPIGINNQSNFRYQAGMVVRWGGF
jgi:hypothetical protein